MSNPELVGNILDALPEIVYAFDRDGQFIWWNRRLREVTGYTDEEIGRMEPGDFVPDDDELPLRSIIDRILSTGTSDRLESRLVTKSGDTIPYQFSGGPLVVDGTVVGVAGVGRDVGKGDRQQAEFERLDSLNSIIRSVDRALIEARTRSDIETAVCEHLAQATAYHGVCILRQSGDDTVSVEATSEGKEGPLSSLIDVTGGMEAGIETATRTGEVVQWDESDAGDLGEFATDVPGASGATSHGPNERTPLTLAAIPLATDDRTFGVLCVCADRSDAFSDRERAVLAELGMSIANAIQGALTRQLLYADTVTELEMQTTDHSAVFVSLSSLADCRIELEHVLTYDDELIAYERVTGATPETIRDLASQDDRISHVECLHSEDGTHTFEFRSRQAAGTLTAILAANGARTVGATADTGVVTVRAELPPDGDVRGVYDAVADRFTGTELVAIREASRSRPLESNLLETLDDSLTDKQRGALEAAYYAGYFEWPTRTSTAEDVARTLGIAPQTFHQHLRIAQRKTFDAVLESTMDDGQDPN